MERLTLYAGNGDNYESINPIDTPYEYGKLNLQKLINKLAEYEELEEQGLLLRLPFKIGQKVYYIYESCIDRSLMIGSMVFGYSCLDFPRTYYTTKEEAEQKLKEMERD